MSYWFKVEQDGWKVAGGYCTDKATAEREAKHYGFVYGLDGPVKITVRKCPVRKKSDKE